MFLSGGVLVVYGFLNEYEYIFEKDPLLFSSIRVFLIT
jgi:hypothetical protein